MTVKYTKDHEWIRFDDSGATIGISAHAAEQLGDVVFVELPEIGKTFANQMVGAALHRLPDLRAESS